MSYGKQQSPTFLKSKRKNPNVSKKVCQNFKDAWRMATAHIPEIEADCIWDATHLHVPEHVVENLLEVIKHNDALPPDQLRKEVDWPELQLFGKEIRRHIKKKGYLIIRNFPLNQLNPGMRRLIFLLLVSSCGTLASHIPEKEEYVWEITPKDVHRPFLTYSEHNLEATLHTDSNYRAKPEEFVAFLVEKAAACGGGETILLRIASVLKKLEETDEGKRCLTILKSKKFPAMIPSVYSENAAHVEALIIKGETVRFRLDTIEMGMKLVTKFKTPEREWALHFFSKLVDRNPARLSVTLEKGDMIFINNYTVLHGRTAFEDKSRLLLRARFNSPTRS
jgi:alpha-ketoglutarate-dependent taurine dioxygenase